MDYRSIGLQARALQFPLAAVRFSIEVLLDFRFHIFMSSLLISSMGLSIIYDP